MSVELESFPGRTFEGAPVTDASLLQALPPELAECLGAINGAVVFRGGLHVRGVVASPEWHSLPDAWRGRDALHRHYRSLRSTDIPFAQDAVGDQFFFRDGTVWSLSAEVDTVEEVAGSLDDFWRAIRDDPVQALGMHPLLQLERTGKRLAPGQLINVYPPFCTAQGGDVSLSVVPVGERLRFLAALAAQIRDLPEGAPFQIRVE